MKVEFRDGAQEVPEHLAALMTGLDTQRMTYEEALQQSNDGLLRRHLRKVEDELLRDHARTWGW